MSAAVDSAEERYAEAIEAADQSGLQAAVRLLQEVLELDPEHADAHYGLGDAARERGDRAAMLRHFQQVQVLDACQDAAAGIGRPDELRCIERVAAQVLTDLPEPFSGRLSHVPVVLEQRPSPYLVQDGFDPRSLGLFEGPTDGDTHTMAPTRIVLYTCNLCAEFPQRAELEEQVEITLLHEVGHYFNLDEDDMERLGLD